jgi:transcriptional regulator EpsA
MLGEQSRIAEPVLPREFPGHGPQTEAPAGGFASLDPLELESLVLNLDASLRVHTSHNFFNWSQGALQSVIRHESLTCVLGKGEPMSFQTESFSSVALDIARFNDVFRQDTAVVAQLVTCWEEKRRRPLVMELAGEGPLAGSAVARELGRIGAATIVAHGTPSAEGKLVSFFIFACRAGSAGAKHAYLVELVVPALHTAWVRTQLSWSGAPSGAAKPAVAGLLTTREIEILKWLYHGKSNIEIGMILTISPLTAKNHVQKILRKLNVMNRTQAVGKALALRILNA